MVFRNTTLRTFIVLTFFLAFTSLQAQITPSSTTLDFSDTYKEEGKTKSISVKNEYTYPITVIFKPSHEDFQVSIEETTIEAGASANVEVTFSPRHNIQYNAELMVLTSHSTGDLSIDLLGQGVYKNSYYNATQNKSQEALKSALKTIISSGYRSLGYTSARDNMYSTIDNDGGKVTCVYTGREASFTTRSGANGASFNCEHTWPQSLFNQNEPERSDIHHLFPTDASANSRRSNYPFNYVTAPTWQEGGSKLGSSRFEPRDEQKGRTARAMFYFAVRYGNYSNFLTNQESVLREWHEAFPPQAEEQSRNAAIFNVQKNRNPFVDYPEFMERISSISTTATESILKTIATSRTHIRFEVNESQDAFNLVVVNTGNEVIRLNAVKITSDDFKVTVETSTLAPGESTVVKIEPVGDWSQDKEVNATLELFSSSDPEINTTLPIRASKGTLGTAMARVSPTSILVKDHFLSISYAKNSTLFVFNAQGQQVAFNDIKSDFTDISLKHLQTGVYFAVLMNRESRVETRRFVIQH